MTKWDDTKNDEYKKIIFERKQKNCWIKWIFDDYKHVGTIWADSVAR